MVRREGFENLREDLSLQKYRLDVVAEHIRQTGV